MIILFLFAAGCGFTCNDYRDDPLGPPPGCECLYNQLFGCGPFDDPDWGAFARSEKVRTASSRLRPYQLSLQRRSNTCVFPPMRETIEGTVGVRRTGKKVRMTLSSSLTAAGRVRGRTLRMKRRGSSAGCEYDITAKMLSFPSRRSPVTVSAVFKCGGSPCTAEYSGTMQRRALRQAI